jgi:transcriptional regulator with XRE-family HTH domain
MPAKLDVFDPKVRENLDLRRAFAARDVSRLYQLLVDEWGYSQRQIARLARQTQSEVSEILNGRQVLSYDLLARIADGFGVPRGWMGLAYDEPTVVSQASSGDEAESIEEGESVKRRNYLAATAAVFFGGTAVFGSPKAMPEPASGATPLPKVVRMRDVKALRALTREMRALGRAGNGGMPDLLGPVVADAERLLDVYPDSDYTARQLRISLAELHTLAGWCAHDMHFKDTARWHYGRAMKLASEAQDTSELVSATWHASILFRDDHPDTALKLLQMAQYHAADSITLQVAMARALSLMDRREDVQRYLIRVLDWELPDNAFDRAGLNNVRAQCYLRINRLEEARSYAALSVQTWDPEDRRESTKARITLATIHALAGESDTELLAAKALDGAESLHSLRVRSQLKPLEEALTRRKSTTNTDLAQRAHLLRSPA